ncbi:hypothetical protein [Acidovorax sp.]|uniref:hypothetical protein n=1 Tax=Acidovorax sp. TaxID=1872122 RepID=UPI00391FB0C1
MYSLLISVIAIALTVAVAAASMYYGGDSLTQGRSAADATAYVTAAQQISGAAVMYQTTESAAPADVAALVTAGNLNGVPSVKSRSATNEWTLVAAVAGTSPRMLSINLAGAPATNQKLCDTINKNAGATGMDATTGTVTAIAANPYACVPGASGTDPQVFQYKY